MSGRANSRLLGKTDAHLRVGGMLSVGDRRAGGDGGGGGGVRTEGLSEI